MKEQEIFANVAREHGLNAERLEAARQNGLKMTTLVTLLAAVPASMADALLVPLALGESNDSSLAAQAQRLQEVKQVRCN